MANTIHPGLALRARQALTDAAFGVLLAIALVLVVGMATSRFWITDVHFGLLLGYLAVWVPLLSAVLVACFLHGSRSLSHDLGLRFRPLDLLWGLAIGLLARVATSLLEIAQYGRMGSSSATMGEPVYDGWWLFGALLAPILLAPLVEEVFFRGLLLRAVQGVASFSGGGRTFSVAIAIVVSGAVFSLVHVLQAGSVTSVAVVGLSTFVFGVSVASVATLTGRLGGAIIAHVTFNALVVIPSLFDV